MAVLARSPVLPEAALGGPLSALLRPWLGCQAL